MCNDNSGIAPPGSTGGVLIMVGVGDKERRCAAASAAAAKYSFATGVEGSKEERTEAGEKE